MDAPAPAASGASKMLLDPYGDWVKGEGVPVTEDFGIDLLKLDTRPWARLGCDGAIAHLKGRGDFVAVFVLDLVPGGKTAPQRHCYEEVVYVLSGHGSTVIETDQGKHSFGGGRKACSRCRSTPSISTSTRAGSSARGWPRPPACR